LFIRRGGLLFRQRLGFFKSSDSLTLFYLSRYR